MKILYYELEPTDPVVPKLQLLSVQLRMQQLSFMTKAMQVTSKVETQPSSAKTFLTNIVPFKTLVESSATVDDLSPRDPQTHTHALPVLRTYLLTDCSSLSHGLIFSRLTIILSPSL
jgi:hypothetical protein